MANKKSKCNRAGKAPVRLMVEREFIGTKSLGEAFVPIIVDDLNRKAAQVHTLDSSEGSG